MLMVAIVYCYINGFIYICNINIAHIINTELAVRIREEAIKNYGGAESIIRVKI